MRSKSQPGRRQFLSTAGGAATSVFLSSCAKKEQKAPATRGADIVIMGGTILPLHRLHPPCEALAIRDGKVWKLGPRCDIEELIGTNTKQINLEGGIATPGLVDAHAHLINLGASLAEIVRRLKEATARGEWIIGRGWDQNLWSPPEMPTHEILTREFPDRAVWLTRVDGHAGWCNKVVMDRANLTRDVEDPPGGEFLRDEDGELTGVLIDAAMDAITPPPPSRDDVARYIIAGQQHALARGLTGIHEMGVSKLQHHVFQGVQKDGALRIRMNVYAERAWFEDELISTDPLPVAPEDLYALLGAKIYADGALGSRGAALAKSYRDRPGHRGIMLTSPRDLQRLAASAMERGWQLATHAIGDRASHHVLDAYGLADQRFRGRDHRFRIEHCQIVDLKDIADFARLSVIASMQPTHATSDMGWVPDRIGERRLPGAYAWRRFIDAGVHLALGSDFPVERADPRLGLYAAMTRQNLKGEPRGGWLPDQRLSLQETLKGFTREAAFATHREDHLGALAPGMQADITCFGADLRAADPAQIPSIPIRATVVAGKICHRT
ncbi:MAG: amidohydrolase [Nannocystaceae bacterium]